MADFSDIMEPIRAFGSRTKLSAAEFSRYPPLFSLTEEAGIPQRIMQAQTPPAVRHALELIPRRRTVA